MTALAVSLAVGFDFNLATDLVESKHGGGPGGSGPAALILLAILIEYLQHCAEKDTAATQIDLDEVAGRLSGQVLGQWREEAVFRRVRQPVLLQVRWSSTGRPVAASRDMVLDDPTGAEWVQAPLDGEHPTSLAR